MNQLVSWAANQSLDSLGRAEVVLGHLHDVLNAELQAISRYDLRGMAEIDGDKKRLVRQLEEMMEVGSSTAESKESDEETRTTRIRVSLAAGQVRAMVYANSALLGEAIAAIAAKLGVDSGVQGYDSRARTVGPIRQSSTTSI